jgi:diguanylate cyclase (GGDEF)-like protein/PAS domain S-box-containing protein
MNSVVRHVLLSLGFLFLYFILNLPGTIFISHLGITAWYPANGLVFALLLAVSPWYGLLVAAADSLAGVIIYHQPILSFSETIGAMAVAGSYTTAAVILRGPLKIDSSLNRGRDVARYMFVATAAALLSTAAGVGFLIADRSVPLAEFWSTSINWFIGDEIGLLCLAPFLLIHIFPHLQRRETRTRLVQRAQSWLLDQTRREVKIIPLLETVGQGFALLAVLWVIFGPRWGQRELLYLSFIPILWMAMGQGVRRAVTGILALNFGIIVAMHVFPPPPLILDRIGILMLVISATGLVVGSAVTERHKIATELNERTTYLNALIEYSPFGIAVLNRAGAVEMANPAFTNLFQSESGELIGASLDALLSNSDTPAAFSWATQIVNGNKLRQTARTQGKAGKSFDVELQGVPLAIGSEVRGAYIICRDISEQVRASKAEREHTEALNELVKELELQTDQMTLLNEMAGLLECCANTEEACSVVDRFARKLFPEAVSGALYTFRASRNLVEEVLSWGCRQACHPTFTPENCWALRRGQAHWSNPSRSVACEHLREMPEGEYLCLPMVAQGETLGVLQLHFPVTNKERAEFKTARQRLGATVAAQIALSLASVQSREKLRDQSIRDPLTGLFNRRFMEASLDRELIRARRKNQSLSVLFLDIDHFKRFNDTFGHEAGDVVLQSMADLLRKFFRGDDIACRWGGEEFAIILPDSQAEHAAIRADALRAEIKNLALRHRGAALAPITISAGIAAFPEDASTAGELFSIADRCLYQSKSAGRDCITVATRGMIDGPLPAL